MTESSVFSYIFTLLVFQIIGFLSFKESFIINIILGCFVWINVAIYKEVDKIYYMLLVLETVTYSLVHGYVSFKSDLTNFIHIHSNQKKILELTEFVDRLLPKNVNHFFIQDSR